MKSLLNSDFPPAAAETKDAQFPVARNLGADGGERVSVSPRPVLSPPPAESSARVPNRPGEGCVFDSRPTRTQLRCSSTSCRSILRLAASSSAICTSVEAAAEAEETQPQLSSQPHPQPQTWTMPVPVLSLMTVLLPSLTTGSITGVDASFRQPQKAPWPRHPQLAPFPARKATSRSRKAASSASCASISVIFWSSSRSSSGTTSPQQSRSAAAISARTSSRESPRLLAWRTNCSLPSSSGPYRR
jgi:hypothetical protein